MNATREADPSGSGVGHNSKVQLVAAFRDHAVKLARKVRRTRLQLLDEFHCDDEVWQRARGKVSSTLRLRVGDYRYDHALATICHRIWFDTVNPREHNHDESDRLKVLIKASEDARAAVRALTGSLPAIIESIENFRSHVSQMRAFTLYCLSSKPSRRHPVSLVGRKRMLDAVRDYDSELARRAETVGRLTVLLDAVKAAAADIEEEILRPPSRGVWHASAHQFVEAVECDLHLAGVNLPSRRPLVGAITELLQLAGVDCKDEAVRKVIGGKMKSD